MRRGKIFKSENIESLFENVFNISNWPWFDKHFSTFDNSVKKLSTTVENTSRSPNIYIETHEDVF